MTSPSIIKYPYDPTGTSPHNLVVGEFLSLPRGDRDRAYALQAGPFYANSVVIKTVPGNMTLVEGIDYDLLYLYQEATKATGQPVKAVIYIHNPTITGTVSVDYQVVGGEFSSNVSAIQALIESLQIDERAIVWDDILDKPVTFPPAPHLHHVGDLYGMEAFIDALDRLTAAMANSGSTDLTDIYQRLDGLDQAILANSNDITAVAQALSLLTSSVNSKLAALELSLSEDVVIQVNSDLLIGRSHLFMNSSQGRLPDSTGLTIGKTMTLTRRQIDIVPTVVVYDANVETVRYRNVTGTGFNYKTRNFLKVTLVEPRVWEVTNDDD